MFYKIIIFLILTINIYSQKQVDIPWPTLADSPWPMIRKDAQITGRSPYSGPKTATVKWSIDLPYGVLSGPIIGEDGTLFVGSRAFLGFVGDSTNYFYAISPETGEIKWTFLTGTPSSNSSGYLINNEGTIFFGSQSGWLYAVDSNGNLKWKYFTEGNIHQLIMNTDLKGNIYFTNGVPGNGPRYLFSVSKEGKLNWKVNYGGGIFPHSVTISPEGNTIYVSALDRKIYALNIDSSIKWSVGCVGIDRQPLLVDNSGNIYFVPGCDTFGSKALVSVDSTGKIRWEYIVNNGIATFNESSPVMDYDGNIYYAYSIRTVNPWYGRIESVDYYGNHRWTYEFEQPDEWISTPLVVDKDGTVYCGSTWGYYYYAISSEGELLWKLPLNGNEVDNTTAIGADGTLYIGSHLHSTHTTGTNTLIAIKDTGTVSVKNDNIVVTEYSLSQNYPNPFNPSTTINYQIPNSEFVKLSVFDILGREVAILVNEYKDAGSYSVEFNANELAGGIYFYTLQVNGIFQSRKMTLLK